MSLRDAQLTPLGGHAIDERPRLNALRQWIESNIPTKTVDAREHLETLSFGNLLIAWTNWASRFVPPRCRKVLAAPEFWQNPSAQRYRASITALAREIESGADLTPFLSPRVARDGYESPAVHDHWAAKDFALNAYDVHHLHLIPARRDGSRGGMSRHLVFVRFYRDIAVLLLLGDHKSFDDGSLEQVVHLWNYREGKTLKGVLPEAPDPRLSKLPRRLSISTVGSVEGRAVLGAMLSSAGTSVRMVRHADYIHDRLRTVDPLLDDKEWVLTNLYEQGSVSPPTQSTLSWFLHGCDLVVVDKAADVGFEILQGPI